MVQKDDLRTWFRNLSPHKRIDFMCGMLHMCLPLELRFVGSCVEDLAKKDFLQLQEYELKANNKRDLLDFSNETNYDTFRSTMAVYLALLHSANTYCSNRIFSMLERHKHNALAVKIGMDSGTVHRILLILSMAMNHPAFSFTQRQTMFDMYQQASEAAERIMSKKMQEPELLILSESCDTRPCGLRQSPMCSPMSVGIGTSPVQMIPSPQPLHSLQEKAYVCNIQVCGSRLRDGVKNMTEYHIQVTWSNGETGEVYKTYQELEDFHNKLLHKKSLKIPKLQGSQNHHRETVEQLNQYFSTLSEQKLSKQQSDMYTKFLSSHGVKTSVDASTSPPRSIQKETPSLQHLSISGEKPGESVIGEYGSETGLGYPPDRGSLCNHFARTPYPHDLNQPAVAISPSYSGLKAHSSLASSPCRSQDSLDSISPPLKEPDFPELAQLLSGELATYTAKLAKFSLQQVCVMEFETFQRIGVPPEAAQRIKAIISEKLKLREMTGAHMPNGLVDPAVLASSLNCHGGYQVLPMTYPPMFPMPGHPLGINPQAVIYHQNVQLPHLPPGSGLPPKGNTAEASPTNSEYSTPSPSPRFPNPQVPPLMLVREQPQKSTDSSSDDDKLSSQQRGKGKAHSAPNSARYGRSDRNSEVTGTSTKAGLRTDGNQSSATTGSSGYNSDPTFNGRQRTQLGHLTIPMPDNSFKPPLQFLRSCVIINPQTHTQMVFPPYTALNSIPVIPHNLLTSNSLSNQSQCNTTNVMSHSGSVSTATSNVASQGSVTHAMNAVTTNFVVSGSVHSANGVPPPVNINKAYQGSAGISVSVNERSGTVVNGENIAAQMMPASESSVPWPGYATSSMPSNMTLTYATSSPTVAPSRSSCVGSVCDCPSCPSRNGQPSIQYIQPNFPPQLFQYSHMPMYPLPYIPRLNGFNQEMMHNHPPMFYCSGPGPTFHGMPGAYNAYSSSGGPVNIDMQRKVKRTNCHNCGSDKHAATECTESSLQTKLGQSLYSYDPKYESEKQ